MVNGMGSEFNCFPHIPAKAMKRKEKLEEILKEIQEMNTQLRYQIIMGETDLKVMVKHHYKNDYRPYVSVPIKDLDPNDDVPEWELVSKSSIPRENEKNPFDWKKMPGKRGASQSPENSQRSKRQNVSIWQIAEFLHSFLEGTATTPKYSDLDWEQEANRIEEEERESEEPRSNEDMTEEVSLEEEVVPPQE